MKFQLREQECILVKYANEMLGRKYTKELIFINQYKINLK